MFRKDVLVEVGRFRPGLGEDIDITLRFQEYAKKHNKKVVFNRNAICYTECPERIDELIRQRVRWQKGFIDAILNNSSFLFPGIFRNNVCFFMIIDAFASNSFATVVFIINIVLMLMKIIYGQALHLIAYYLNTILFNVIGSVIAIRLAKKHIPKLKVGPLYYMIFFDMTFFQLLRIFFFIRGTIAYYFDNKHWYKVSRTKNSYKV